MRVRSWNVNGLRAVMAKGFPSWLKKSAPDIVGVQEVRAQPEQLEEHLAKLRRTSPWHVHISPAERKGYSGVGLLSRRPPDSVETLLGVPEFDVEGRVQMARFGKLLVVNVYVPNGNGRMRDNSRVPFKIAFSRRLHEILEGEKQRGGRILVMGDINTAHRGGGLARPKQNQKTSGFLQEEREELDRWLRNGWVDTFRHVHPESATYSWWSSRFGVREKNIGWRIDLVLASPGAMPFLQGACIETTVKGSDHAPVGVELHDDVIS
jgi:exodeoxyribonuclease III